MQRLQLAVERELVIWVAVCLFLGAYLIIPTAGWEAAGWRTMATVSCGVLLLVSGMGLFLCQLWAKYTGLVGLTMFGVLHCFSHGIHGSHFLVVVAVLVGLSLFSKLGQNSLEEPPDLFDADETGANFEVSGSPSLVALLSEPRYLDGVILARLAQQAWQVDVEVSDETAIDDENDDGQFSSMGSSLRYLLRAENRSFVVYNLGEPYFESPEEYASQILDSRVSRAIEDHRAWISIDLLDIDANAEERRDAYRQIANLLAELVDDDCLAICCPETGSIYAAQPNLLEQLRDKDPLTQLSENELPPVIYVDEDDPRMQRATETARKTWAQFVGAFENREHDQIFSVKAPLHDATGCEQIWLNVTAIENGIVYGTLGNKPIRLTRYQIDDRVRIACRELSDWMYFEDETLHGGFTIKVLSDVAEERARRRYPEL